jgi:Tfp pilus assembly protein PilO
VTVSDRDRKLLLVFVPLALIAAYWFLLLGPKRDEAAKAGDEATKQEARLDAARQAAGSAESAQTSFESDFTEVVRLGKAIPAGVDMPSLIVQLDRASAGTGIRFTKIATGDRATAATTATPAATTGSSSGSTTSSGSTSASSGSSSTPPVAAGGQTAQSGPGSAVESANNSAAQQNANNAAAEQSGVSPSDTQTSSSARSGGLPVGGGATTGTGAAATGTAPAGLETVPLELEFVGDFFNLADFFHDVKRFVRVANSNVLVGGRLVTVEGVRWSSDPELFPRIKAEIKATVYLSPKAEGTTAGATPAGPATPTTTPAGTAADSSGGSPVPTATATP